MIYIITDEYEKHIYHIKADNEEEARYWIDDHLDINGNWHIRLSETKEKNE